MRRAIIADRGVCPYATHAAGEQSDEAKGDLREAEMNITTPNPGSIDAIKAGCTCPVLDNARGKGIGGNGEKHGWWITAGCPMHGKKERT